MTEKTLADILMMPNALGLDDPAYTTADVNALMPSPYDDALARAARLNQNRWRLAPPSGAGKIIPPVDAQTQRQRDERWQANPYEMALAMAMGPKVRIPMRPTAGTTAASPRQAALRHGREEYAAKGGGPDKSAGDVAEAKAVWDRDIDFNRAWDYRQALLDFQSARPPWRLNAAGPAIAGPALAALLGRQEE